MLAAALCPPLRGGLAQTLGRASSPSPRVLEVRVDDRVEVMSILYALAGATEYSNGPSTPYRAAMVAHFRPFLSHPAVAATQALRARGIGHEAPMRLAFYLDETLHPIRPLVATLPGLERFAGVDFNGYLDLVRRFAADAGLAAFVHAQAAYVQAVELRFREFLRVRRFLSWFDTVFGIRQGSTYALVPGMVTGLMSYGGFAERANASLAVVIVVSLDDLDAGGLPRLGDIAQMLVVHELAHTFVNPIIAPAIASLEPRASQVLSRSAAAMRRQAYTTATIALQESVVRALVVMYMRDVVDEAHRLSQLRYEEARGFAWTTDLVDALTRARAAHGGRLTPALVVDATRDGLNAFAARVPAAVP